MPFQRFQSILAILFFVLIAPPIHAQQSAPDPSGTLNALEQTARNSVSDISRLRIEKWKTDGNTKKTAQSDSDSIQRNISSALPELITNVRKTPLDLNANFRLYRNLNVLYEYFSRFAETTGAFGSREDFDLLARDLQGLDDARRAMADRLESLSASAQAELNQLHAQARAAQAAAAAAPPKKIVIDDTETDKKPSKKAKKAPKPANSGGSTAPANTGSGSSTSASTTPKG